LPLLSREQSRIDQISRRLPATIRDAIARQIEGLSVDATQVLVTAAVVGREFEPWLVGRALDLNRNEIARHLREAAIAQVVERIDRDHGRWRFSHALVRDVLYQSLENDRREMLHAAVGNIIDGMAAVRRERLPEVAHHLIEAVSLCGAERAIDITCEAASAASESLAYEEAADFYRRALQVAESSLVDGSERQCSILLRLGEEQLRSGNREGAKQSFERAARIADSIGAPELLAAAAIGVAPGFFAVEAGVPDDFLVSLLRRALQSLGDGEDEWRALVMARLGAALFWSEDGQEGVELSRRAWELADRLGNPVLRLQVVLARWLAEWTPSAVDERRELASAAVELARSMNSKEALVIALLHRCVGELECGEMGAFDRSAEEFRSLAIELKQPQALWYASLLEAARALHAGRFVRAEERMREYVDIGRRIGDANVFLSRMAQSLVHASERGDVEEIVAISEEASRHYPVFIGWRASRCWGLALTGQVIAANRGLDELIRIIEGPAHRRLDWPTTLALMSEVAWLLKREDAAEVVHKLLLPLQGRTLVLGFCVMTWGPVSRYLGLLAETLGRHNDAENWYARAIHESARSEGDPWLARSEAGLYRVRRALGGSSDSLKELRRSVLERAGRLGMVRLQRELLEL
jgi:tetratricopeptide (TPR) repeat protein